MIPLIVISSSRASGCETGENRRHTENRLATVKRPVPSRVKSLYRSVREFLGKLSMTRCIAEAGQYRSNILLAVNSEASSIERRDMYADSFAAR